MFVKLSPRDSVCAGITMCPSFVFQLPSGATPAEEDDLLTQLEEAANRVVRKWPLLAGKPVWLKEHNIWAIDVPDDLDTLFRPLVTFTSSKRDKPYHVAAGLSSSLPSLSTASSAVLPPVDSSLFRAPSFPRWLSDHAKGNLPFLNIHATLCADAICAGILVSHGVIDGMGMHVLLAALNAELRGEAWEAPALSLENALTAAEEKLVVNEAVANEGGLTGVPGMFQWSWAGMTATLGLKALASWAWERWYGQVEKGNFFLSAAAVEKLASAVKREVHEATQGKEYVSTADAVVAWLIKAIHSDDPHTDSLLASGIFNPRALLARYTGDPFLLSYPHTAPVHFPYLPEPLALSTLSNTATESLALTLRRALDTARTLPALQQVYRQRGYITMPCPVRDWPLALLFSKTPDVHRVYFANHAGMGTAALSLPFPTESSGTATRTDHLLLAYYWLTTSTPNIQLDGLVLLQQRAADGGGGDLWFGQAPLRRSRWAALRRETEKLELEQAA
ncbi:hypothetical protein JCM10207_005569 [Rhodosporidiobolus poonsookiae]